MSMAKFRVLMKMSMKDMLVEAEDEKTALDMVVQEYKNYRPFGGHFSRMEVQARKPWKFQLEKLGEQA
jgi:hypothetical protein